MVTATRDSQTLRNTAASVGIVGEHTLRELTPGHSSEVMNRIPGVNIVQLGSTGEGVAAAIRQPVSYGPVYLYLENGVPTRASAFFNHNALYGVNTSGANGIEIIKGPGSALYGSDAMGAVINILSGQPPKEEEAQVGAETGENGWMRARLNVATIGEQNRFTARVDVVQNDGWRQQTESERKSLTASWFHDFKNDWSANTVFTANNLDFQSGGSALNYDDYRNTPERAGNLIGYREAIAYRLSSAFEKEMDGATLSITPYARSNELEYVATWTLNTGREVFIPWLGVSQLDSQDAHINRSGHDSIGVLLKYREDFSDTSFWIAGVDLDYSRGDQRQNYIVRTDDDAGDYWLSYEERELLYDYEVNVTSVSPYLHVEHQLSDKLRLSGGVRYDSVRYDYTNNLSTDLTDRLHKRPGSQAFDLEHLSPKLSLVYDLKNDINAYAAYRHAFRIPSSGQLFRAGQTEDSTSIEPVKAESYELGLRGNLSPDVGFELAVYRMTKEDDILSITDSTTGGRRNVNAGETSHIGIELGSEWTISEQWQLGASYSRVRHRYEDWIDRSGDFSGNEMMNAPRSFTNVRLAYQPVLLNGGKVELEWQRQGAHQINEANTINYGGHQLLHLRTSYNATDALYLYMRVLNLADIRYADTTSKWGPKYTPGRPRSLIVGARYRF